MQTITDTNPEVNQRKNAYLVYTRLWPSYRFELAENRFNIQHSPKANHAEPERVIYGILESFDRENLTLTIFGLRLVIPLVAVEEYGFVKNFLV